MINGACKTYVHVDFAAEQCARRRVQEESALQQVEHGQDEDVALTTW